jgi:hypothetical protein
MKLLRLKKQISGFLLLLGIVCSSCTHTDEHIIKKMNIIPPKNYEGFVVIFYQQKMVKGRVEFKDGEHFFYIPDDGVVFTPYKLAHIVEHCFLDSNLKIIEYKDYQSLKDSEECSGCLWARGSTEDAMGNIFVTTFGKMGLKGNIKNMMPPDLEDIYSGKRTGEIKYWRDTTNNKNLY